VLCVYERERETVQFEPILKHTVKLATCLASVNCKQTKQTAAGDPVYPSQREVSDEKDPVISVKLPEARHSSKLRTFNASLSTTARITNTETNLLRQHRQIIAVSSQNQSERINTLCGRKAEDFSQTYFYYNRVHTCLLS